MAAPCRFAPMISCLIMGAGTVQRLNEEGDLRGLIAAFRLPFHADHDQPNLTGEEMAGIRPKLVASLVHTLIDRRTVQVVTVT